LFLSSIQHRFLSFSSICCINPIHHPADIGQTSPALGILMGAVAAPGLLLGRNLLQDQGTAISEKVLFNGGTGISEAVADQFTRLKIQFFNDRKRGGLVHGT
jgi:hypothetical protein